MNPLITYEDMFIFVVIFFGLILVGCILRALIEHFIRDPDVLPKPDRHSAKKKDLWISSGGRS